MKKKSEILTFKADDALMKALENVPNRSAFIRDAVFAALEDVCPVCHGAGTLSVSQKKHWEEVVRANPPRECDDCRETVYVPKRRRGRVHCRTRKTGAGNR